ncbi:MAG: TRAP transporter small permease [Alphaproteobacteria bacterium]|nr:TRAP transporter small permease [Alphaproteobacteria bacterium]MBU1548052.1 TRAP transporter small permease [Alphaproteobacteria bacterium]MBU2336186.1 TRAP transporter small permease [Alphaproteobacteria bacterium]MBU2390419.1 TRAP transporter small permease [Alphaproteobacteria bacterium]|tara:strand:+ start:1723 stop:2238 length:516 start_codon:yes stop_codon:yes gene_type:complete
MSYISGLADKLSRMLAFVAAIGVLAMMIHVCTDILSRVLTGASLPATVEMVSYYYMLLVAFLPLAWVERRGGMISVELLDFMLSPRLRRVSDLLIAALGVVIYAVMAYASWLTAVRNYETGTFVVALQTKIITWPGYFLPPAGFALAAIIVTVRLLQIITGNEEPAREHQA